MADKQTPAETDARTDPGHSRDTAQLKPPVAWAKDEPAAKPPASEPAPDGDARPLSADIEAHRAP